MQMYGLAGVEDSALGQNSNFFGSAFICNNINTNLSLFQTVIFISSNFCEQ